MADTIGLGPIARKSVEVQLLSWTQFEILGSKLYNQRSYEPAKS